MSVKVLNLVWESDVKDGRLLLLALADNATDGGYCFPGAAHLGGKTMTSRSSVFRALKKLEAEGLIQRRNRFRENGSVRSNAYRINLDLLAQRKRVVSKEEKSELELLFDEAIDLDDEG